MRRLLLLAVLSATTGVAHAQGTITSGDASFVRGATPWDATPEADLTGVSIVPTDDQLFETGWAFRVQGDSREFFLPAPSIQDYQGGTSEQVWTDVANRGLFSAVETSTVNDLDGPAGPLPSGRVTMRLTITNISGMPLTIDLFHMLDIDLGGAGVGDSATLVAPVPSPLIHFSDNLDDGYYKGDDVDAILVTPWPATVGVLLDDGAIDTFDNSGLPNGPGDLTAGMQWTNRTVAPGSSLSVAVEFTVNRQVLTPDLSISGFAAPDPVERGTPLNYTYSVTNLDTDDSSPETAVSFGSLAPGITVVGSTGCAEPLGYPTCTIGTLAPGDVRQVELTVLPGDSTTDVIQFVASTNSPWIADPDPSNNSMTTPTNVISARPDLQVDKNNSIGGEGADIDGWDWILTARNSAQATANAEFAVDDIVLIDSLPNDAIAYGMPSIVRGDGVTGTLSCDVVDFDLTCRAAAPMVIPPGDWIEVTVSALPDVPGIYSNPRIGGSCSVDPGNLVVESNEVNNACSDSVLAVDFMIFGDGFED